MPWWAGGSVGAWVRGCVGRLVAAIAAVGPIASGFTFAGVQRCMYDPVGDGPRCSHRVRPGGPDGACRVQRSQATSHVFGCSHRVRAGSPDGGSRVPKAVGDGTSGSHRVRAGGPDGGSEEAMLALGFGRHLAHGRSCTIRRNSATSRLPLGSGRFLLPSAGVNRQDRMATRYLLTRL